MDIQSSWSWRPAWSGMPAKKGREWSCGPAVLYTPSPVSTRNHLRCHVIRNPCTDNTMSLVLVPEFQIDSPNCLPAGCTWTSKGTLDLISPKPSIPILSPTTPNTRSRGRPIFPVAQAKNPGAILDALLTCHACSVNDSALPSK